MRAADDPVVVVGIGADGWEGLSPAARRAVADADVLLGGRRQLDLVGEGSAERVEWPSPMVPALPALFAGLAGRRVCALASGDPMHFGLGATLCRVLGPDRVRVLPHPSSVSLACARLGWPVQEVTVLSAVGRPLDRMRARVQPGSRLLVLSADEHTPARVAELLVDQGYGPSELTVLEQLGGPAERRVAGSAASWREPPGDALNVLAVCCRLDPGAAAVPAGPGLPDDVFTHDGQLTKREVRALTLARLGPLPDQLLWDVGAGAGSIAIEWMRGDPTRRAIAVESHPERAGMIEHNAAALGVPDLRVVRGRAPEALRGLEPPSTIFIGGGVTAEGALDACWDALGPGGRLVANAVTVQAEAVLATWHAARGGDLTRISIQRASPVGRFTGWRPMLPVTQWAVDKP